MTGRRGDHIGLRPRRFLVLPGNGESRQAGQVCPRGLFIQPHEGPGRLRRRGGHDADNDGAGRGRHDGLRFADLQRPPIGGLGRIRHQLAEIVDAGGKAERPWPTVFVELAVPANRGDRRVTPHDLAMRLRRANPWHQGRRLLRLRQGGDRLALCLVKPRNFPAASHHAVLQIGGELRLVQFAVFFGSRGSESHLGEQPPDHGRHIRLLGLRRLVDAGLDGRVMGGHVGAGAMEIDIAAARLVHQGIGLCNGRRSGERQNRRAQ